MKIILTENQTWKLIRLLESNSFQDYMDDLEGMIKNERTYYKGINNNTFTKEVAVIQSGLNNLGYEFEKFGIDGKFGNETEENVKKFQEDQGLEVTGKMTVDDLEVLMSLLSKKEDETPEPEKKQTKTDRKTQTINGGTYIIEMNNPSSDDITVIWGGYPSQTYGAKWMKANGGDKYFSDKNVVYSNFENSLDTVKGFLSQNGIENYNIKSVSGFSAGGTQAWKHINDDFDFVGLIDPTTKKTYENIPENVKLISRWQNWTGYKNTRENLKYLEGKGISKTVNIAHLQMPEKFYELYSDRM